MDFRKITQSGCDGVSQGVTWLICTHLTRDMLTLDTTILAIFHYLECFSLKQRLSIEKHPSWKLSYSLILSSSSVFFLSLPSPSVFFSLTFPPPFSFFFTFRVSLFHLRKCFTLLFHGKELNPIWDSLLVATRTNPSGYQPGSTTTFGGMHFHIWPLGGACAILWFYQRLKDRTRRAPSLLKEESARGPGVSIYQAGRGGN